MNNAFESAAQKLFAHPESFFNAQELFDAAGTDTQSIVSAFLLALGGNADAAAYLENAAESDGSAQFFLDSLGRIEQEIGQACLAPEFLERLEALAENPADENALRSVFFPEGAGLPETRAERVQALREKRKVRIAQLNPAPLSDPGRELLFTSNVLLTIPSENTRLDELEYSDELKAHIRQAVGEKQLYWFDHPIQIGVEPQANEILYGLRGLDETVEFERARGNMGEGKVACVLSASVTHKGLHGLAKDYIESEIRNAGGFKNIDVYVFTEAETNRLIDEVLVPAGGDAEALDVFGVDGEYGRHYSFLKAISALWNATKDPNVKATFKIDLDQVFPQRELVEQSGASAFEHFKSPLWGARGTDADGKPVELGMIAGALVNERDIHKGLFTPDVPFPEGAASLEEKIFFSKMLMALSTEGELMTRYGESGIDGKTECIQRIHVTGGTNGIRVDSLKKHRPFTPSFIGRAEDQSYILSVLMAEGEKLGYVHEDGLVMRHDKEAFAGDAIKAASFGNMIGDYIRTLYFSEYARVLNNGDIASVKAIADPFTGCFITPMPVTVVMLRFCMKAAGFFLAGEQEAGTEFVQASHPRLTRAMAFVQNGLRDQYRREHQGWNQFYDLLEDVQRSDALRAKAVAIIDSCRVQT
ncbi:hypothetical protein [Pontiella sulfatireligans]|uniref:Uncharacterized protein n=1 Tax=Pontiella sulfatireligans TaxID=2750658 RepID=A0A6C2UR05_9BACT|nr:hypothetical protein [Pontiella sulfatireligans]VGO22529.1 hypothetical protein SCARR_04613 [Pontiella sulfatireligans]